jgi:hypothetical protein
MDEQPGYTPEERERGENQAWHIPVWGCLAVVALIVAVAWLLLR